MTNTTGNGSVKKTSEAVKIAPKSVQVEQPPVEQKAAPTSFPTVTKDTIRQAFEQGRYPYEKKMSRREYENKKAKLQAELLKVQLWAQDAGEKFVLLFEGRDARGVQLSASPSTSTPEVRASLHCQNQPKNKPGNGFFNAILSIYQLLEKSYCMIAAGIIAPVSNE